MSIEGAIQVVNKEDFIETESLLIAKKPNDDGAYIAHIKVSSIASRGEGKSERAAQFIRAQKDLRQAREKIGQKKTMRHRLF